MYIKKLELVNFQVIKNFEAEFDGNVYLVTGENELGKSTLLKAIGALLTGQRDDVLRNGASKGWAQMVVGDDGEEYEVRLSYSEANPRGALKITQKSTGMVTDNVSMLQKIFGYKDFDAVEFSRWSETADGRRKQIKVVKSLLPADVLKRVEEIDTAVAGLKEKRADVSRDKKAMAGFVDQIASQLNPGDVEKYAKPSTVDIQGLMETQRKAAQLIEKAKTVRSALEQRTQQIAEIPLRKEAVEHGYETAKANYEKAIQEARAALEKAEADRQRELALIDAEREDFMRRKENAEKWLSQYEANNPEKIDVAGMLAEADAHNKKYNIVCQLAEKRALLSNLEEVEKNATASIEAYGDERAALIAGAKLPVDGLTFTEDGLELNGIPFVPGKVSDSQCIEVAAKLIVAANPTVKVFRIARGESLGSKRLQAIVDMAKANGFQGFVECVQRGQNDMRVEEYTEQ